jgi:hypothetical protein
MTLRFDPPPNQAMRYALWVDQTDQYFNGPVFRTYRRLGDAKNGYHSVWGDKAAKILENVNGAWYVLFDIPKGTKPADVPWRRMVHTYYGERNKAVPMTRDEYAAFRLAVADEEQSQAQSNMFDGLLRVPPLRDRENARTS